MKDGTLVIPAGAVLSGVVYEGEVPKVDYEVELEAQRVMGTDFFCGLTFPYKDSHASLILGGWGGGLCGISSINGEDAAHNHTGSYQPLKTGQWYKVRLRATKDKIQAWVDGKQIVNNETKGQKIDIRQDIALSKPFGFATYQTTAALRNIRIRAVTGPE